MQIIVQLKPVNLICPIKTLFEVDRCLLPVHFSDNTASILTKRGGFRRREQPVYRLPVLIVDSGSPALSSTNTLSVRVCDCDSDGVALSCGAVAYTATGLSTGALLAILGCIITLLGKTYMTSGSRNMLRFVSVIITVEVIFFAALVTTGQIWRLYLKGSVHNCAVCCLAGSGWSAHQKSTLTLGIRERGANQLTPNHTCFFLFLPKIKLDIIDVLYLNQIDINLVHQDKTGCQTGYF